MTFAVWKAKYDVRLGEATNSYADRPSIAYLPNGGYVVGWRENNQLKFKVYDGGGNTDGTVYSVDAAAEKGNNLDIQAIGTDGSFVVSWNAGANINGEMKSRVFTHNGDGSYTGGEIRTEHTNQTGAAELASLSVNENGGSVSTYTDGVSVYLRLHGDDGSSSTRYQVFEGSSVDYPRVAQISVNKYVVSYGFGDNLHAKIVTVTGLGATFADVALKNPQNPNAGLGAGDRSQVVALKDANGNTTGQFAIVTTNGQSITARFYDQGGKHIGSASDIVITNDAYLYERHFDVTALRGGRIAVTYSNETFTPKIVLKVLDANGNSGNENNDPLIIDAPKGFRQPTITEMADGRLSVAWEDWTRGQVDTSSAIVDPRLSKVAVQGTARNDYYVGTEYSGDELYGRGGKDTLLGGNGDDYLIGGDGGIASSAVTAGIW
jgi:hypothetical protein